VLLAKDLRLEVFLTQMETMVESRTKSRLLKLVVFSHRFKIQIVLVNLARKPSQPPTTLRQKIVNKTFLMENSGCYIDFMKNGCYAHAYCFVWQFFKTNRTVLATDARSCEAHFNLLVKCPDWASTIIQARNVFLMEKRRPFSVHRFIMGSHLGRRDVQLPRAIFALMIPSVHSSMSKKHSHVMRRFESSVFLNAVIVHRRAHVR
jgi:hypothetical protein